MRTFWESPFEFKPLDNEEALRSCMSYLDFNPVRSAMAENPEQSDDTSIKECIAPQFNLAETIRGQTEQQALNEFAVLLKPLLGFGGVIRNNFQRGILFSFEDCLELADCTGWISLDEKHRVITGEGLVNSGTVEP